MADISREHADKYQYFFNFMSQEHDLILTCEQMDQIVFESRILNSELNIPDDKYDIPDRSLGNRPYKFKKHNMEIEKKMNPERKQTLKHLHSILKFQKYSATFIFVEKNSLEDKIKYGFIKGISECIDCIEYELFEGEMHLNLPKSNAN